MAKEGQRRKGKGERRGQRRKAKGERQSREARGETRKAKGERRKAKGERRKAKGVNRPLSDPRRSFTLRVSSLSFSTSVPLLLLLFRHADHSASSAAGPVVSEKAMCQAMLRSRKVAFSHHFSLCVSLSSDQPALTFGPHGAQPHMSPCASERQEETEGERKPE
jgi:hypothetical protein